MKTHRPTLWYEHGCEITRELLNQAIPKLFNQCDSLDNSHGVFRYPKRIFCPFDKKKRTIWFIYVSKTKDYVNLPEAVEIEEGIRPRKRRSGRISLLAENNQQSSQRRRVENIVEDVRDEEMGGTDAVEEVVVRVEEEETVPMSVQIARDFNFWNSNNAKKLFYSDADKVDGDICCRDVLKRGIEHLRRVSLQFEAWRYMVYGCDDENLMSPYQIERLKQKCQLLCYAYRIVLQLMPMKTS